MSSHVKSGTMLEQTSTAVTPAAAQISNQGVEALKDITFGSAAGIIGKFVEYPFDTVKVRLQSQPDHLPLRYTGPLDCFRQGIREGGILGLYRGISAPLVGAAAENACLFFAYRVAKDVLRATVLPRAADEELPLSGLATAGAISGGLTSLVLTPIELVKCRLQVASPADAHAGPGVSDAIAAHRRHGPLSVIAEVYRHEGLAGFWRGQLGTLLRESGGSAAWFGSYETLSLFFRKRLRNPQQDSLPLWQQMASGAVAGMSYNFIFYPADTIKSKIQTGELTHVGSGFWTVGRELYHKHGLRGLYRGCGITVARSAPSSALIFTIYEALRKTFA